MITNRKMGDKVLVCAVSHVSLSNDTIGCCCVSPDPAPISFGTAPPNACFGSGCGVELGILLLLLRVSFGWIVANWRLCSRSQAQFALRLEKLRYRNNGMPRKYGAQCEARGITCFSFLYAKSCNMRHSFRDAMCVGASLWPCEHHIAFIPC